MINSEWPCALSRSQIPYFKNFITNSLNASFNNYQDINSFDSSPLVSTNPLQNKKPLSQNFNRPGCNCPVQVPHHKSYINLVHIYAPYRPAQLFHSLLCSSSSIWVSA
ncbi:hypothetical protein Pst134EB_020590 [Puccinia striiformis f. sp. tritici]|nr:hypothetical protein Pst134EB_020590 [Puccinia striiformis f. sp. tritici]